ncbi:MAG: hypothetical protein SGI73_02370 [Chloroflexota bacterium]|mgnify:CR=1 FL=1|nr:hypothetical protein [Chloroflexota bacterium]
MFSTLVCVFVLLTVGYFAYCCVREIGWWLANRVRMNAHKHDTQSVRQQYRMT